MQRRGFGWVRAVRAGRALLARLHRDVRGNALVIGAAALIPLAGMVGGGIDLSRMYIVKTRMQHACDAGALAGRKAMGSGVWSQASYRPRVVAEGAYDANFPSNAYGARGATRSFAENAGTVTGSASATVPMTLMRILGKTDETLSVSCDAEMRLPNTDVMFVLDTTGSMADTPSGDSRSKMASLKEAVKCFYEIVARLNTDANCTTGTPSGGTGTQVQIRFGFVPYATNVNVGRLLKPEWMADRWFYQTRRANFQGNPASFSWIQRGQPTSVTDYPSINGVPKTLCTVATAAQYGYNTSNDNYSNGGAVKTNVTQTVQSVTHSGNVLSGTCTGTRVTVTTIFDRVNDQIFKDYTYDRLELDVSGLKNGTGWNSGFSLPIGLLGASKQISWDGCIEERSTVRETDYDPIPSGADDLDIDTVPTATAKRWGPLLNDVIYTRQSLLLGVVPRGWTIDRMDTNYEFGNGSYYACPVAAKTMQSWPVADDFDDYVDSLKPEGNTYHDIGLLWGARLLSPTGLFKADNAFTPQGGEIERNLIFMTDGDACTDPNNYTAYGVNWYDRRQTDPSSPPTGGCTSTGTMTQQVNARMAGLCTAIKNKNIVLWVIAFGNLANSTETRLSTCATPGRYFKATNAATLQATFKTIADQISMLRLTK